MTPEEKSLLERTYKLVEENNSILRGMRRTNRINAAIKVSYWIIIIGLTFGAYYYLQPYLVSMLDVVDQAQGAIKSVNGTVNQVQDAFDSVRYGK